jgi:hypothetical protein
MRENMFVKRCLPFFLLICTLPGLIACGDQPAAVSSENSLPITRVDGAATLVRVAGRGESALPETVALAPGDEIRTATDQSVTIQLSEGNTLHLEPDSRLTLFSLRPADRRPVLELQTGAATGQLRGPAFTTTAYKEVVASFQILQSTLTVLPHTGPGSFRLWIDDNTLKASINEGEFDIQAGNQQATLPAGWLASVEPGKALQIEMIVTPTPAPSSAVGAPTATPITIITLTPTNTPTVTPQATATLTPSATATPTAIPTKTATQVRRTIIPRSVTPTAAVVVDTPLPPPTDKPEPRPKKTNPPQPTNPPPPQPTNPPPPQPTEPPPTQEPPTPRPTVGG